ncbi:hypothetical protein NGM10_17925 (plasmid) [Halorussus salilacus]|uniref:hypothetical protein n=1 Tax=Halorussus salilacus TaxID=2953750 RepID=UPI0020A10168|nr:hypothetical protein [Halorussus salilacus]USZ70170.1 hypothetical protein NGM10_17925 [Halorussus salilacus]
MKDGTGSDPFADDSLTEDGTADDDDATTSQQTDDGTTSGDTETDDETTTGDTETDDGSEPEEQDGDTKVDAGELPWAVRRNSVKSDREMVQFYLREFVQERESEFQRAVENETGYDTYLTDVREAAYLVAMNHPEEVAGLLDEWGCEYL